MTLDFGISIQQVNSADFESVTKAAESLFKAKNRIGILVINAGITRDSSLKKKMPESLHQHIDVNFIGVFFLLHQSGC